MSELESRLSRLEEKVDEILSILLKETSGESESKRMMDSFAIDVAANVLVRMLPDDKVSELNDLFKTR